MDGFDVVAAVPDAVSDDPDAARNAFRKDLIPYASLPFYRKMLERSGFGDDLAAFDEGMAAGDVPKAIAGLSDELLGSLAGDRLGRRRAREGQRVRRRRRDVAVHRRHSGHPGSTTRSKPSPS